MQPVALKAIQAIPTVRIVVKSDHRYNNREKPHTVGTVRYVYLKLCAVFVAKLLVK